MVGKTIRAHQYLLARPSSPFGVRGRLREPSGDSNAGCEMVRARRARHAPGPNPSRSLHNKRDNNQAGNAARAPSGSHPNAHARNLRTTLNHQSSQVRLKSFNPQLIVYISRQRQGCDFQK